MVEEVTYRVFWRGNYREFAVREGEVWHPPHDASEPVIVSRRLADAPPRDLLGQSK